ncbi:hypothetical protein [Spirosoma fluviale]|uniref:Crassvirus muzzle protein N-terminal region domain-containing protein n=1 Tax=Spirosoma fluviale TaxID=1597977 RepID=A0A286FCE4_9BACT|nr:hypothetical protein [Spirosoma fluviale]SOD80917.1 hypothetical protein SAMN06269250_1610 [Spirosoma fluviale]
MAQPTFEQTFQAGMVQDVDAHLQPTNTFRDAENGQLMYNGDDAEPSMGHGLAFMNAPGNRYVMEVPAGYWIIGQEECSKGTLLCSTNNQNSEIGLWYWDSNNLGGRYITLYNDANDPNLLNQPYRIRRFGEAKQDRLNWLATDSMDLKVTVESELIERIYWTDRRHAMHTFNLNQAWNASGVTYHSLLSGANLFYPKHLSVHAFRERSDLVFPRLNVLGRGKGRLLSGVYQFAIQYRHTNGHESVWSTLTRRVFVTTNPLDDQLPVRQTGLRSNHHNRVMQPSGLMSGESIRLELQNLDLRWDSLRVAVVYFESPDKPYKRVAMKPITMGSSGSMVVEITQLDGEELTDSALNQRYSNVVKVGTLEVSENMLIEGQISFLAPVSMDKSAVKFTPKLRNMSADRTASPTFANLANPISGKDDNDPLTNSPVENQFIDISAFAGQAVRHSVDQDFANYKGQLYDHLLKGHFRGETYEYGVAVLDRSGQVLFVEDLPAFTFPEQYAPGPNGEKDYYSLTKLNPQTGLWDLQIMGVTISGLALPVDKLYDQDGRLNVSGFMIVRRKRNARIKHQGVVFPVCRTQGCYIKENRDFLLFPLPTADNGFYQQSLGDDNYGSTYGTMCKPGNFGQTSTQAYFLNYHSPDVLIEESFEAPKQTDELKHIGMVGPTGGKGYTQLVGNNEHIYTKSYNTRTDFPRVANLVKNGRPNLGDTTRIALALQHNQGFDQTYKEFDKDYLKLTFETQTHVNIAKSNRSLQLDGLLQRNAVLFKSRDWKSVDLAPLEPGSVGNGPGDYQRGAQSNYRLVNYTQATPAKSPEKEPYFSTGHFQPLTADILTLAKERYDASGKLTHFVFDEVEVWGGDCYVSLFDFTRIYPFWSDGCEKTSGVLPDYAVSHILPIESKYNLALRWGRSFAANATKPEATSCEGTQKQFNNGITSQQPEDWKYNIVLNLEEAIQFYNVKDPEQDIITNGDSAFHWTPEKAPGQRLDSWRTRYVGDYGLADASLGPITKLSSGSFSHMYVWQTKGFGAAPLNASQFASNEVGVIVINSGKVFNGMVYLSREAGTQHPSSVWVSKGQIGAWDARNGVLLRHSQAGLDELSNQESLHDTVQKLTANLGASDLNTLRQWNAVSGVNSNGDVLTTFWQNKQPKKTLVYSPTVGAFVGSNTGYPRLYGKRGRYMFATNPAYPNKIYLYHNARRGEFFDVTANTVLRFIVNPNPTKTKRFDNGYLNLNVAGIEQIVSIRQYTPNGGPKQDHTILGTDERIDWRDNMLIYPMHEEDWDDTKDPLRDHYAIVEITISNKNNIPVELLSFGCSFLTV